MSTVVAATMDDLSQAYLAWSRSEHVPANTVKSRARVFRTLPNAGTATREDVEAWWATRRHLAPATRALDVANLRSFYKWCRRWEHRDDDPTLRIDAPHVDPGLPRPMTRADLHKALDAVPPHLRRAICLAAYAGLRVSEAAALDWDDVDLETQTIRVMHSKGGKSRRVPMSTVLLNELLPCTGGNVVMAGGEPYAADSLTRRMHLTFRALGIRRPFTRCGTGTGRSPTRQQATFSPSAG